jgi:hypothetical protein
LRFQASYSKPRKILSKTIVEEKKRSKPNNKNTSCVVVVFWEIGATEQRFLSADYCYENMRMLG